MPDEFAVPKALLFTPPYGPRAVLELGDHLGLDADERRTLSSLVDDLAAEAVLDALAAAGVLTHSGPDCARKNPPAVAVVDDYPGEGPERRITCPRCVRAAEEAERAAGGDAA